MDDQKKALTTVWIDRLEKAGMGIGLFALALLYLLARTASSNDIVVTQILMMIAAGCVTAGFCVWAWTKLQPLWGHPARRVITSLFHLAIGVVAIIYARHTVSRALGLPPQDFDIAVTVLSLLYYLPIWALVVSFALSIAAFALFIAGLFSTARPSPNKAEFPRPILRAGGAVFAVAIIASVFDFGNRVIPDVQIARWAAYVGDFQEAPNYPGIKPKERIRLHENGVISRATLDKGEVVIRFTKFEESPTKAP